jgi:hypothetical protein
VPLLSRALLAATACLLCTGAVAGAATNPARAGAFYNSVGVDTHLTFSDTAYGAWPRLVAALDDLGVKHLADGVYGNPDPSWAWFNNYFQNAVQLAASHGMRFAFEMGQPGYRGGSISQLVSALSGPLRNAVEAVVEPNEFDQFSGLTDWASPLAAYDRQLYTAMKANPSLASLPVIGPSLAGDSAPAQLGDQQQWLDIGNIHPYTGGLAPTPAYTASQLNRIGTVSGNKPVWATELGYYTALNAPRGTLQPVSEATAAVYLLRELLENFKSGIARTYAYELIDDSPDPSNSNIQEHFGLLRNDYTPKPAFTALKNLLALVGQQSPATLAPLKLDVSTGPNDLRQLVLEQADHTYVAILWRTASIWDTNTRRPLHVSASPITLQIPDAATVTSADPITTGNLSPLDLTGGQANLRLGADPIVIQIKTGSTTTPSAPAITPKASAPSAATPPPSLSAVSEPTILSSVTQSPVKAPYGTLALIGRDGSVGVVAATHFHAADPRAAGRRPPARGSGSSAPAVCRGPSSRMPRLAQPTLHWLSVLLRTLSCTPRKAVAVVQLYSVAREHAGHGTRHFHSIVTIVGRRRLSGRSAPAAARWIVGSARREARRGHTLLVGFMILR